MMKTSLKNKMMFCLMIAIEAIFCFTPLGSIPIGPIVATLSMVPVIISSLAFGELFGLMLGFVFAVYSFIYWTFIMPAYPTAFLFTPFATSLNFRGNFGSIIICFVPRILGGWLPARCLKKVNPIIASAIGSLTNTVLVLLFILIFFKSEYETIMGKAILSVLSITVLTNGLPECIVNMIVCPIISKALKGL